VQGQNPLQQMTVFTSVKNFPCKLLIFAFFTKSSSLFGIVQKL